MFNVDVFSFPPSVFPSVAHDDEACGFARSSWDYKQIQWK